MDESEHKALIEAERSGAVLIGIDRPFARRAFTDIPLQAIEQATGETPYVERAVVGGALLLSPVALLAGMALSIWSFGWWSLLAIPLAGVVWLSCACSSSRGNARLLPITLLAIVVVVGLVLLDIVAPMALAIGLVLLAAWLHRFAYVAATILLRAFVIRNSRAFEFLSDGITLKPTS